MERTTMPFRGPAPVVYRSLPVLAAVSDSAPVVSPYAANPKEAAARKESSASCYPCVTSALYGQVSNPIIKDSVELADLKQKLSQAGCTTCELRRTATLCEFQCVATAGDGIEHCKFAVSVWSAGGSKCLLQADRYSGCPFFFKRVVAQALGTNTCNTASVAAKPLPALFRCPKLEAAAEEATTVDSNAVESAIRLATSKWQEQRVQGVEVLAELIAENPEVLTVFRSLNGFERLQLLRADPNAFVQRAVSRILVTA